MQKLKYYRKIAKVKNRKIIIIIITKSSTKMFKDHKYQLYFTNITNIEALQSTKIASKLKYQLYFRNINRSFAIYNSKHN